MPAPHLSIVIDGAQPPRPDDAGEQGQQLPATIYDKYPVLLTDVEELEDAYDFATCYTRTSDGPIAELDVAAALIIYDGSLSAVGKVLKRSRRTIDNFIARSIPLTELVQDIEAAFLDAVEVKQKGLALKGDGQAGRFFLQTKGKDRGYVTRNENTGKDGAAFTVNINGKDAEL